MPYPVFEDVATAVALFVQLVEQAHHRDEIPLIRLPLNQIPQDRYSHGGLHRSYRADEHQPFSDTQVVVHVFDVFADFQPLLAAFSRAGTAYRFRCYVPETPVDAAPFQYVIVNVLSRPILFRLLRPSLFLNRP